MISFYLLKVKMDGKNTRRTKCRGKERWIKLNEKKTKIMCNEIARRGLREGIEIGDEVLEKEEEYRYIGKLLTPANNIDREIDARITTG